MKRFLKICGMAAVLFCGIIFYPVEVHSDEDKILVMNKDFYLNLLVIPPIMRDDFFKDRINRIVSCRGVVKSVDSVKRYRKKFRIVVEDAEAKKLELMITYYVFIDSRKSVSLLEEQGIFEFTGQLVSYTPTNIKGDSYILDIIFEKGAVVLE